MKSRKTKIIVHKAVRTIWIGDDKMMMMMMTRTLIMIITIKKNEMMIRIYSSKW